MKPSKQAVNWHSGMAHIWSPKFGPYPTYKHGIEDRWCILQVTGVLCTEPIFEHKFRAPEKGHEKEGIDIFLSYLESGWNWGGVYEKLQFCQIHGTQVGPSPPLLTDKKRWWEDGGGVFDVGKSWDVPTYCSYCAFKGRNQQMTHPSMLLLHHLDFILFIKSCKLCR
jgi:hypothetical protein